MMIKPKLLEHRDYQCRIHNQAIDFINNYYNYKGAAASVLIESPTGSGKTVMGMKLCKYFEEKGHKIGWIAHRTELLNQASECNDTFFNVKNIKFISLFTRDLNDYLDCTVLVFDEAQHDVSNSAVNIYESIQPKIIIGLTATPFRSDNNKLAFKKVIRDAGIHQLIREGYLAKFNSYIFDKQWTPYNIAKLYADYKSTWGKSIVFFHTKKDAIECADILSNKFGVKSTYVIGSEPREAKLKLFKQDKIDVLTNVMVLTEGFDESSIKTAFVRPSCKSVTIQMAGRALRKYDSIPICNIVQNQETKFPFTKHASANSEFIMVDNKWLSITPKSLDLVFYNQLLKLSSANLQQINNNLLDK